MSLTTILLFAAALGWCGPFWGMKRPRFFPDPKGPGPNPDPDPIRRLFSDPMPGIFGILGGVAAGYAIHSQLPQEGLASIGLAALAGGTILSPIATSIFSKKKNSHR